MEMHAPYCDVIVQGWEEFTGRRPSRSRLTAGGMRTGDNLSKFVASLMLRGFYGTAIIRFEGGKVTRVETETRRMWQCRDLPEQVTEPSGAVGDWQSVSASIRGDCE